MGDVKWRKGPIVGVARCYPTPPSPHPPLGLLTEGPNIACQFQEMNMSPFAVFNLSMSTVKCNHVAGYTLSRVGFAFLLYNMPDVACNFKKWPCHRVKFRGERPRHYTPSSHLLL